MRRDPAVDQAKAGLAAARSRRERRPGQCAAGAAREIEIVGIDRGSGQQLRKLFARAGQAAPFGHSKSCKIEIESLDTLALDQGETRLCCVPDHRVVDAGGDQHAAHRGLAAIVEFDAVAMATHQRADAVKPKLRQPLARLDQRFKDAGVGQR